MQPPALAAAVCCAAAACALFMLALPSPAECQDNEQGAAPRGGRRRGGSGCSRSWEEICQKWPGRGRKPNRCRSCGGGGKSKGGSKSKSSRTTTTTRRPRTRTTTAAPAGVLPPEPVRAGKKFIDAEAVRTLKDICDSTNRCNERSLRVEQSKDALTADLAEAFNFPEATAAFWVKMNYDTKRALFKRDGLDFIEPKDDGTFSGVMVTPTQAAILQARFAVEKSLADLPATSKRRRKRYAMFLEKEVTAKWDLPIKFYIASSFNSYHRSLVLNAIKEIHSKTCIDFVESSSPPAGNYMHFQSTTNPGICGLSFMGRIQPYNQIFLNFGTNCVNIIRGTVIHEMLHALGVEHQQARYDRNEYIKINWDNIDPQAYDYYAVQSHTATSYGVEFDYLSVMLYGPKTGSVDYKKDAYTVLKHPSFYKGKVGQRRVLSDRDAKVLRKMYCSPGCSDLRIYCGWWATDGYCQSYFSSMAYYCKKSCDLCPAR